MLSRNSPIQAGRKGEDSFPAGVLMDRGACWCRIKRGSRLPPAPPLDPGIRAFCPSCSCVLSQPVSGPLFDHCPCLTSPSLLCSPNPISFQSNLSALCSFPLPHPAALGAPRGSWPPCFGGWIWRLFSLPSVGLRIWGTWVRKKTLSASSYNWHLPLL